MIWEVEEYSAAVEKLLGLFQLLAKFWILENNFFSVSHSFLNNGGNVRKLVSSVQDSVEELPQLCLNILGF